MKLPVEGLNKVNILVQIGTPQGNFHADKIPSNKAISGQWTALVEGLWWSLWCADRTSNNPLCLASSFNHFLSSVPRILQIHPRFISPVLEIRPHSFLLGPSRGQVVLRCRCLWVPSSSSRTAAVEQLIPSASPPNPILLLNQTKLRLFLSSSTHPSRGSSSRQQWQLHLLLLLFPLLLHPTILPNTPLSSRRSTSPRMRSCWRSCLWRRNTRSEDV